MDKLSKSKLREAAMSIREHNQIHSRKEPRAVCIAQYLEFAADLIEKIADGKISLTEQRHGRLIAQEDADGDISFVCSECSRRLRWAEDFCPSCGTRMDVTDTNILDKGGADND